MLGERRQFVLEGEVHVGLAPLLDGTRTLSDLAAAMSGGAGIPQIVHALSQLQARGCLAEGPLAPDAGPELALFEALPGNVEIARLRSESVSVAALPGLDPEPLSERFAASGVRLAADSEAALRVVISDDHLRPELEAINRAAVESGRPWLLVKPYGLVPWIGPLFVPGRSGCWACLRQRLLANRQMERYVRDRDGGSGPIVTSRAALPASLSLAWSLSVAEAQRWLAAPGPGSLEGLIVSLDLRTRELQRHVLTRRPQCQVCGERAEPVAPGPLELTPRIKRFTADGGHRVLTPLETYEKYKHHVSPITGAVTELRESLGRYDRELAPSFVAGHNFSMGVEGVVFLKESLRGMSGGKGASPMQARASGLCEAIERYSGIWTGDEYARRGSWQQLAPAAVHPNQCMGFSEEQYRIRDEWNRDQPSSRTVLIPRPFDAELELDWVPLWSLSHQRERLLPSAFCYYGHPEFAGRWCAPDSNGCAAGNVLEEAILQGLCEVVERDSVALWWYNRIRRRGVDLASFGLPYLERIQEYYATLGRRIWALDLTADLGISCIAAVSVRETGPSQDLLVGFGAHFDPKVSLLRAITEVNQFLPSVLQTRDDGSTLYMFGDELARDWWTRARLEDLDYLTPHPELAPAKLSDFDDPSTDDIAKDVEVCVERARAAGHEVLVMDMTRPDIGLSVVRVVVPELCHFWRRLGFERLYQVPVKMGWLAEPHTPEQLNPWTIFF